MRDRDEMDEIIIAIPFGDPQYNVYKDISELPSLLMDELSHFLSVYKQLENKKVELLFKGGNEDVKEVIKQSISAFNEKFNA